MEFPWTSLIFPFDTCTMVLPQYFFCKGVQGTEKTMKSHYCYGTLPLSPQYRFQKHGSTFVILPYCSFSGGTRLVVVEEGK